MQQNPSHFDQKAQQWDSADKVQSSERTAQKIKEALLKADPQFQFSQILEVGCGTGLLGQQFFSEKTQYMGIDSSQEMLKVLKEKFPEDRVQALYLDIENANLPKFQYQFVLSQMAFHHLKNPSLTLKKLNTEGQKYFAIVDLDKEDGSFHPDPKNQGVHHFGFSKAEIEAWARESGLKLIHHELIDLKKKNQKEYPIFMALLKN